MRSRGICFWVKHDRLQGDHEMKITTERTTDWLGIIFIGIPCLAVITILTAGLVINGNHTKFTSMILAISGGVLSATFWMCLKAETSRPIIGIVISAVLFGFVCALDWVSVRSVLPLYLVALIAVSAFMIRKRCR